jgi:hypothetical protein
MPRTSNNDIAQVLADIANDVHDTTQKNLDSPAMMLLNLRLAGLITDFLDGRSNDLVNQYDKKLQVNQ